MRPRTTFCPPPPTRVTRRADGSLPQRQLVCASLRPAAGDFPIGTLIAAGVSIGILGASFENMLNVVYKRRTLRPSDDELCDFCSGFGTVRCEVCGSRGELTILGTSVQRQCPVCEGRKRERCRRCAGSGKSGMKKSAVINR